MSVTVLCVYSLYNNIGGNVSPPSLNRICTPPPGSTSSASLGLIVYKTARASLASLDDKIKNSQHSGVGITQYLSFIHIGLNPKIGRNQLFAGSSNCRFSSLILPD